MMRMRRVYVYVQVCIGQPTLSDPKTFAILFLTKSQAQTAHKKYNTYEN